MAKKSKNLRAALEKIDSTKAYSVEEAVALAKETNSQNQRSRSEFFNRLSTHQERLPIHHTNRPTQSCEVQKKAKEHTPSYSKSD